MANGLHALAPGTDSGRGLHDPNKTRKIFPGNFVENADKRYVTVFGDPSSKGDMSSPGHDLHMEKAPLRKTNHGKQS